MKWFLAKLVYRIICGNGEHTAQFDEQLRLIHAENQEQAYDKAYQFGIREEETFFNQKQQLVQWKFINVSELLTLHELVDGAEVYSRINEVDDGHSYTTFVHQKAQVILNRKEVLLSV
ncbi:MAG TPA: DUF4288 domain-containing protein [Flavisolibacter sp.]|jgi:hypothetical protein|nr:DUF4288 domain-containing protein [Flavisolibacter sp.]